MKKKLPKLNSDVEAEAFVDEADLTQFDLSDMRPVRFEFKPKSKSVTMRMPESLFEAITEKAKREGVPYQRLIREAVERSLAEKQKA
jgi:predicted DNA binding CopG/RHH family protein